MISKLIVFSRGRFKIAVLTAGTALLFGFAGGCAKGEEEKKPEVSVQTAPAERKDISQIVNAEEVIFPLQQAVVAPTLMPSVFGLWEFRRTRLPPGR